MWPSSSRSAPRTARHVPRRWLAGALVLAAPALLSAQPSPTVELATVERAPLERTIVLPGELRPYQAVDLQAKVTGFVEKISVDRGSQVRRGDLIATLSAPEVEARLAEAQAQLVAAEMGLVEAQARLAASTSTHERLSKAAETPGVVAGNDLTGALQAAAGDRARVAALEKSVEASRAALQSVERMRDYLRITAPFDGVVTARRVHVGTLVGPGTEAGPLVRLEQVKVLRLVTAVPESDVGSIRAGAEIRFTVSAHPDQTFTASVLRSAQSIDTATRTMAVEADVENPDGRLVPGMYAQVSWRLTRAEESLFVPRSAIAETTERVFVIRVRDGKAEWVDVRRGAMEKDRVEVFGELSPGDRLVLRATDEIRPGAAIGGS